MSISSVARLKWIGKNTKLQQLFSFGRSPEAAGIYESRWRMSSPTTGCFGDTIWVILTVEASGTMGLTQVWSLIHLFVPLTALFSHESTR